jgi:hypothetical protein
MAGAMSEAGPCALCGAVDYALSLGGPTVCPACDAGLFADPELATKRLLGLAPLASRNERATEAVQADRLIKGDRLADHVRMPIWVDTSQPQDPDTAGPFVPDCPIAGCELWEGHPGPHEPERCPPWCKLPHGHPGTHEPL